MTKVFKETERTISLHGLGFLQVKLGAKQRLHVWHPDLPRRKCFLHSDIHSHRFGFSSTVLKGMQINDVYAVYEFGDDPGPNTHVAYVHEGERSEFGNRPWIPRAEVWVGQVSRQLVEAGETYHMLDQAFHATVPGRDGKVATLMTKTHEGSNGAKSLCLKGVEPDVDFDRFQMTDDDMWAIVRDVMEN